MNREKDLRAVSEWSFLADDLKLYLDTHPDDAHALAALKNALAERKAAVAAYEKRTARSRTTICSLRRPTTGWSSPFPLNRRPAHVAL